MNHATASNHDYIDALLGEVVEEYLKQVADGQQPAIDDYAERYPSIAHVIRQTFPALQLVGQSLSEGERSADFDLSQVVIEDRAEYRIDLASGLPSLLIHSRQSAIMNSGQIERTEIRLLP